MMDDRYSRYTERYAYSPKALARLVLSYELRGLADSAAAGVPTGNDDAAEPGEEVGDALGLVLQAQEILTRAVLFERAKGTSWETIAEQLDTNRQAAHERYRKAERESSPEAWRPEPRLPAPAEGSRALRYEWSRTRLGRRSKSARPNI
ncbi:MULTISPECIES: hypothetical protein [unclassified Streptomyces]|uniref:hypothetical protein n=1 Tax=unclassified Streptomyces TaxID=2593676 RepID=UPI002DDB4557|nr:MULTISPECIES: hypothetical protein [unclassified Streptomyces]WSC41428.1 hypothetical protein OHA08_41585 [Streptomyces sp. NBC_01763]WSC51429.1 hypothetical protein OG808_03355 [Streptomyces sp. NBC_01761]WSF82280.1 hypothetical protein OIE70_03495 [Streptomyces sp. NBC_01744]